jgi:oxaloacetate decarboxylase alpha subunit
MPEIIAKPVKITETVLRDGHQSLIATRMTTEQMLPILEKMDRVGYYSVECWGGATFDACLRFLSEDPWDRLRKIREGMKNTKLQMLFRAQNILGYRHYADDVVDYFVKKSLDNGIDIIRIFDALNDLRNMQTAVKATKAYGGHVQTAISYTLGEPYTVEYFVNLAKAMEDMGADSICIKDMAGLLIPYEAEKLVKAIKEVVSVPLQLHTHYTSGVASMSYLKAIEAGCDIVDTAMSPFALGTSQPSTEVIAKTLAGTPFDTGLNEKLLLEIADYFRPIREQALASGLMNPKVLGVDINTLKYQVPGGMLSNLVSQLKDQHAEDKFYDVLNEIPHVREDLGMPPLVTPSSQIVGTQAVMNVLFGERYKVATKETKALLHGEYGKTVRPFNAEVQKKVIGDAEPITCRPADLLENELPKLREEIKEYSIQDEDVLTYALFPKVAIDFFKERQAGFPKLKAAEEAKKAEQEAKEAPKAAPKAEAPAKEKLVPLPAPFLGSWPGVVGEEAAKLVSHAPKAGDVMEGSVKFGASDVKYKIDCLG